MFLRSLIAVVIATSSQTLAGPIFQPPAPSVTNISLNVAASQVTGPFTLNGAAFPLSELQSGEMTMQGNQPADVLVLGQTFEQSFARFVINGSYGVKYRLAAGAGVLPANQSAEVISDRAVVGPAAIPVDVRSVRISATFTLNGSAFPAWQYDRATFYLQPVGSEELIVLGESNAINKPVTVVAGAYHVIYDFRSGTVVPLNKRSRVRENLLLTVNQALRIDVVASTLSLDVKLNGGPFPKSVYDAANLYLRDTVTGAESLLMNTAAPKARLVVRNGTYDLIYRYESGTLVPRNTAARLVNGFAINGNTQLTHSINTVNFNATVRLNNAPFPVDEYDDGVLFLRDPQTNTTTELGNTHDPFAGIMLIPGSYDVLYSHETGDLVPQNILGTVASGVVVNGANLNINVVGVQVSTNITLNGAAFSPSIYESAKFILSGSQSAEDVVLGSSQTQNPSVMVMPGTYDLYYRHFAGDDVPRNANRVLFANRVVAGNTVLSTNIVARKVSLSATLNAAPFPNGLFDAANIFARTREGDDVLMLRTNSPGKATMLITGEYEFYYRRVMGSVPLNVWARVGQAPVL